MSKGEILNSNVKLQGKTLHIIVSRENISSMQIGVFRYLTI
jgi:hypothetical protein